MKRKMLIATKKIMSRQIPEAEVYKELGATILFVTQEIPVVTRTRLLDQNSVATLSKSVMIEFKKKLKEQVAIENC